jgi:hypothetical protein
VEEYKNGGLGAVLCGTNFAGRGSMGGSDGGGLGAVLCDT